MSMDLLHPFSSSPLAWTYLVLMFLFFFISLVYRGVRRDASVVRGTRVEHGLFLLVNVAFIALPLAYAATDVFSALDYDLPPALSLVGLSGLLAAFLIRAKAHLDLGKSFTIAPGTKRKRELITGGIYSRIRHPMYLSMLVWGVSTPLVLHNYLVGLLPLASITAFLVVRLPTEEAILREEFGDEYQAYQARTGGLLPRLLR